MAKLRKLSPTETFASEICFAGFSGKRKDNPRAYWESVAPDVRRDYCETAAHVAWLANKFGHGKLISLIEEIERAKK